MSEEQLKTEDLEQLFSADVSSLSSDSSSEELPVQEIFGSLGNIQKMGTPSENEGLGNLRYIFFPTWRSQLMPLILYCLACIFSILAFTYMPILLIKGRLFTIGNVDYFLHLPLQILLPGGILMKIFLTIYDSKYIIDRRGVEAQVGLVSLNLRQPRLRWEDIRGVEPNQTLWERLLGIGNVLIGSAMTQEVEVVMEGVANPRAIQLLIGQERDRRLASLEKSGTKLDRKELLRD